MSNSNQDSSDELNYKQAYLRLLNRVTDMIARLREIQSEAEDICINEIDEMIPDSTGTTA